MRKVIPVLVLTALALVVAPAGAGDDGLQYGCTASTGLDVSPVTAGPQCTFSLVCEPVACGYVARVDANGAGLVAGRIEVLDVFDPQASTPTTIEWRGFSGAPDGPPSCTGVFTCTAPGDGVSILVIENPNPCCVIVIVTIGCLNDGVGLGQSVSCSLTSTQRDVP